MPYALLLFATLLAACTSAPYLPPVRIPSERPVADQARPIKMPPSVSTASSSLSALVYGKKAVGHRDFAGAKKVLPSVFAGMEEDFYCGCRYSGNAVDLDGCGYRPRKSFERASRIEWEHVVPAWVLGQQRKCWQSGGRANCTATDPVFQMAEGDLINLVPAVGEVNGDRSNFPYSAWTSHPEPMYGACQTIVDFKGRRAQPRTEVRGRAARITLYMYETYKLNLSSQDKKLMCAWAKTYPVDDWERERNTRIVRWQGRGNPWVTEAAKLKAACG
ncbi:endonuclease [Zoogloea oleivorans]|uniref:Endonuclease n=1 Tax=Zoogloea oleivorans TaxID=1552750 RepID=A0A6C2CMB9_9RHOO|nr:endonuclease [Zoogloea oleivorans]TYC55188.1 endonuclease [Zoogloea oleivorans]